ncbi:hypothetical protein Btru_031085 [Bulinus truncatus]|nr:hypothetical protein Btru_031085 [Bulinus truncatus]
MKILQGSFVIFGLILRTFQFDFLRTLDNCSVEDFRCSNEQCISNAKMCDGKDDCDNGYDEAICGKKDCSVSNILNCVSLHRTPRSIDDITVESCWALHYAVNCIYGLKVGCQSKAIGQYIGRLFQTIYPLTANSQCSKDQWKCDNGDCILKHYICDSNVHCDDLSDERNCGFKGQCHHGFECSDSKCLRSREKCDGISDCIDRGDERDCEASQCNGYKCSNGPCISNLLICDGLAQCTDNSDERFCGQCNVLSWRCSDSKCVHVTQLCDGVPNCSDGSDEENCTYCHDDPNFTSQSWTCANLTEENCTDVNFNRSCCFSCSRTQHDLNNGARNQNPTQVKVIIGVTVGVVIIVVIVVVATNSRHIKGFITGNTTIPCEPHAVNAIACQTSFIFNNHGSPHRVSADRGYSTGASYRPRHFVV